MKTILKILGGYFNLLSAVAPKLAGKQMFYFFCYPFKAKLTEAQQEFLFSATDHRDIEVDGIKVKMYRWGQGAKKVLFVHGWQSNSYRWRKCIEALDKDEVSVFCFDAPGHGNSGNRIGNVPLFEKSITALEREYGPFDVMVGHSIGSFALLYYMHKNQRYPGRLVSMAPPWKVEDFMTRYQQMLGINDRSAACLDDYFQQYAGHEISYFNVERFGKSIKSDTLLIHDKDDRDTPYHASEILHAELSHAELVTTTGLGHRLRHGTVVDRVVDFISREEAPIFSEN